MNHEENRFNPVNPKNMLHNRKENMNRLVGQGATPSVGLSQYRGGGTKKGQMRKTARLAYEKSDELKEPYEMGRHLRDHLLELHGKGFHDAFHHGMSGGSWEEFFHKVGHEFKDPNSVLRGKVIPIGAKVASYAQPFVDAAVPGLGTAINTGFKAANYVNEGAKALGYGGKPRGRPRKGGRNPPASEVARATTMIEHTKKGRNRNNGVPLLSGNVDGVWSGGSMLDQPMPVVGTNISLTDAPNMSGKGMTGAYEGQGKRRRAPAGANDGRRKRAEIVKRVMNEKGLSMINASKYVKEHGLY